MKKLAWLLSFFILTPNGSATEVFFEPDPSVAIAYLNLAVKAGAVHDPEGKSGLTNLTGEMLLRGTKKRSKVKFEEELDQLGAKIEIETRAESVILRGAVLTAQLQRFLTLLHEMLAEPLFSDEEFKKLKSEMISQTINEMSSDRAISARRFTQILFQGHPFGNPITGKLSDLKRITIKDVTEQFNRIFQSQYFLLVGSGKADLSLLQSWAMKLDSIRPNTGTLPKLHPPERPKQRRIVILDKPARTQAQIHIGQIGTMMSNPNYWAIHLGNHAFGGGTFSARLMSELRVKRGWTYGAYSSFRFGTQPRSWQVSYAPKTGDVAPSIAVVLEMLADLKQNGIRSDEFKFAQESLMNSSGFLYDTPAKRVENMLLETTLNLPSGFFRSLAPELAKLKREDVTSAFHEFLTPGQETIVILGTAKELKSTLAKTLGVGEDEIKVQPYTTE